MGRSRRFMPGCSTAFSPCSASRCSRLALTKQLMLLATFVLMFLSARMVLGRPGWALVVALLLFTIPQIGWEAQRTLSHSVLRAAAGERSRST